MSIRAIRPGYQCVTPYLVVQGAVHALEFYKTVFDANIRVRMPAPGGKIGHAEIEIGGSVIMLSDEGAGGTILKSPPSVGGSPVCLYVYVKNSDAVFAKAIAAGSTPVRPVGNQYYGDRSGVFADPFGHLWHVATYVEDVPPAELQKRLAAMNQPNA
jgi:PhnB protein